MEQEGFNILAKVDVGEIEKANKLIESFEGKIKTIQSSFSSLKMPNGVLNGIQSLDNATQSYMKRLESTARLYAQDGNSAKAYETSIQALNVKTISYKDTIGELTRKSKEQINQLEFLGKTQGTTSKAYQDQKAKLDETITSLNNYKIALRQTENLLKDMPDAGFHKMQLSVEENVSAIKRLEAETKLYTIEGNKVKANATAWQANKLRVEEYQREIKRTQSEESKLRSELSKLDQGSEAYTRTKTKINEVKAKEIELNSAIKKTQSAIEKIRPTGFNRLVSAADKSISRVGRLKSLLKSGFDTVKAPAMAAVGTASAVGAFSIKGAEEYGDLEQRYKEINNLATLGGEKQVEVTKSLKDMQSQGRDMSLQYGKSQKEIAEGYEDLVKRGYTSQQALGSLKSEVQASVASGDDFADVTKVSSQALESFGLKAKSTEGMLKNTKKVVNELAYAADATSTGFSDLGVGLSYVGATAHQNHLQLGETASAMGVLSNAGLESDKAGTGLRNVINNLVTQTNNIGSKNSIFSQLGIKKEEMLDSQGNLKSLADAMDVVYAHIKAHSKNSVEESGFFKSIFGTTGQQAGQILATNTKELRELTGQTDKAGKSGTYAAELAKKNSSTAKMSIQQSKMAMQDLQMQMGKALLPALGEASQRMSKFLRSKDGQEFEKGVVGAIKKVSTAVIDLVDYGVNHKTQVKWIAGGFLAAYSVSKGLKFIKFLGDVKTAITDLKGGSSILQEIGGGIGKLFGHSVENKIGSTAIDTAADVATSSKGGIFKKIFRRGGSKVATDVVEEGADVATSIPKKWYSAPLETLRHSNKVAGTSGLVSGFKNLSTVGKVAHVASVAGIALDAGSDIFSAIQHKDNATQRSKDIGGASGAAIGGALGLFGGPLGSMVGGYVGEKVGQYAGGAADKATKGWQSYQKDSTAPTNKWSWNNVGWSTANTVNKISNWSSQQGSNFNKWTNNTGKSISQNWNGTVKNVQNFGKITEKMWDGAKKSTTTFFKDLPKNFDSAKQNVGKFANSIGQNIHKGWNTAADAGHNFFKNLPSNINKTKKNVTRWADDTGKSIKKGWDTGKKNVGKFFTSIPGNITKAKKNVTRWADDTGKSIKKGWDTGKQNVGKFFTSIPGEIGKARKDINKWTSDTGKNIQKGWETGKKGVTKFVADLPSNLGKAKDHTDKWIKDVGTGIQDGWDKFSKGFAEGWSKFWGGLGDNLKGFFSDVQKKWDGLKKGVGDLGKNAKNGAVDVANEVNYWLGGSRTKYKKAHANGGAITQSHSALVGEEGPELAYKPYANEVRLLGANGPAFERVHSGERILNARDTKKVMNGGLGRGTILKGYANGTTTLKENKAQNLPQPATAPVVKTNSFNTLRNNTDKDFKTITVNVKQETTKLNKNTDKDFKNLTVKVKQETTKLSQNTNKDFKSTTKNTEKETNLIYRHTYDDFKETTSKVSKETNEIRVNSEKDYTNMRKNVEKQMDYLHDGVIDSAEGTSKGFGKALNKMTDYAQDAMKDTISQLNNGISSIDKVLSQFGGNSQVIKPVHFATGTDSEGRLTQNTLAMVNDAQSGPRQEALISDKNEIYYPQGNNVTMMIPAGWGVLNGEQTQKVQQAQQDVHHFAKGSGLDEDKLIKIAEAGQKNPSKDFKNSFLSNVKPKGPDLKQGVISMAGNGANQYGVPWDNAIWSVINDAIGGGAEGKGGTREAFLKYAEKTFSGVPYAMGAMSKAATDCSGMVAQALAHFGIDIGRSTVDMQTSKGVQSLGQDISKTQPGDIVVFGHGTGAAGHVGIISNPKTHMMFNANGGYGKALVSSIDESKSMGYEYFRVKGLHDATSNDTKKLKEDSRLKTLAKNQLGSKAIKWIQDNLGDSGDLGGNPGGEGVERWRGTVKKVLRMLNLSTSQSMVDRVLRQINTESSGNPRAKQAGADPDGDGSGPAMGLMQTKRVTFDTYKRSANSDIFNGPDSIYAGLNYAKHRYGPSLYYLGQGHGYAKGGRPTVRTPFIAGEQGPELITADGPVKVDTHEETKRKLSDVKNILKTSKSVVDRQEITEKSGISSTLKRIVDKIKPVAKPTKQINPTINININGSISSTKDAQNVALKVKEEVSKVIERMADAFGSDVEYV